MAVEFSTCVEYGLKLSKRVYYGKESVFSSAPAVVPAMSKSSSDYLPSAPMVYVVVPEPEVVDNPDVPSYQPYVYGRCEPPALIPLQMHGVAMEIESYLDTAFVSMKGTWRVHCVMAGRRCDCRIAVPMGEQGSLLGVEVDVSGRSYRTQLITMEDITGIEKMAKSEDGRFLKGRIYTLKVPQVLGGSTLSIKMSWSQKLIYRDGRFCLNVPFSFPAYVNPVGKTISKREKILVKVNPGTGTDFLCGSTSHPLKEVSKVSFSYEAEVPACMMGEPLENAKNALMASLSKLNTKDTFNIIAFNGEVQLFSSIMKLATSEAISNATEWIDANLIANGGTNILLPINQAMKLLAETTDSVPLIFLITDGAVEDEKEICHIIKGYLKREGSICPRICTFGIGSYCNHYFLQMLAHIGRGHYDAAYDADTIDFSMQRLIDSASSVILADIQMDALEHLDSLELFPSHIPDLSSGNPLIISGRYNGSFPDALKISGNLADMSNFVIELKVQRAKDLPLDRVLARRHIDILTACAWFSGTKELEEKVAKMSVQTGVPCEYTRITLVQTDAGKKAPESAWMQQVYKKLKTLKMDELEGQKIIILGKLGVGFGNLTATAGNLPPATEEAKPPDAAELLIKAASNCCGGLLDRFCCMCFLQSCSYMSDRCAVAYTQLCTALACLECLNCCYELCA
ncbi:hypothetical protein I3842_01G217500 [Carya illinoinensis]|uniref:VWFA domain-containing protein n=1 Tax=Carya illinoinensis TaxID=32201 RepID=A0A922G6U5_CARIL|nr:hypothetical protein I3842_01G217500 [Carya illinoinensis]